MSRNDALKAARRRSERAFAKRLTARLAAEYGSPRLNNKDDPVDELFFILLSQMTTGPSYERVFDRLKAAVTTWDSLLLYTVESMRELIAEAGLSNQKAPRLLAIAHHLSNDFGDVTLARLSALGLTPMSSATLPACPESGSRAPSA